MSWADRSRQERADLKSRREGRRHRREALQDNRQREKERRARSPADWAAVRFDQVRKRIARVRDPDVRDEQWRALVAALEAFCRRLDGDDP